MYMNLDVCRSVLGFFFPSWSCNFTMRNPHQINMSKQDDKKFTWVINYLSFLHSSKCRSDTFVIGGCKWRLVAIPYLDNFCLFLDVYSYKSLPSGWRRYVKFRLTVVNQLSQELSVQEEGLSWFDSKVPTCISMFPLAKLHDRDGGFLVNEELKIVAEVDVLEVIGKLDEPEDSEETTKPLSTRTIEENDGAEFSDLFKEEASTVKEEMDVNGFQVLPSQVESVRHIFERHPDIAVEFRAKNQYLRNACMNFLLSIIGTLCQSLEELSYEDLVEADIAMTYLKDAGFKVDWLEKKLDQVKEKKEKEHFALAKLQEIEENLLKLKQKCLELDALADEEKAGLLATRTPLSFDDVV